MMVEFTNVDFQEKRLRVSKLTRDPIQQIELFDNEPAFERLLQMVTVAQETLLYTRDKIEIHTSELIYLYKALSHLSRLTKMDITDFDYCYVLSNLDRVTTNLIKSCEATNTYSESPMSLNRPN